MCRHDVAVGSEHGKYPYGFLVCARCGAVTQAIGVQQNLFNGSNGELMVSGPDGRAESVFWFDRDEFPEKSKTRCWAVGMKPPVDKYEIQLSDGVRANVLSKAGVDGQEADRSADPGSQ